MPTGDNAAMASFFGLLQNNVLNRRSWATREQLRIAIVTWIERTYHRRRPAIVRDDRGDLRWWTWAGFRVNATLTATLSEVVDPMQRFDDCNIRLRGNITPAEGRDVIADADAGERLCLPEVNEEALAGLKFSAALPKRLATAWLAARLAIWTVRRRSWASRIDL